MYIYIYICYIHIHIVTSSLLLVSTILIATNMCLRELGLRES